MYRPNVFFVVVALAGAGPAVAACSSAPQQSETAPTSESSALVDELLSVIEPSQAGDGPESRYARCGFKSRGERLFKCETFGGNGRTCATCHGAKDGTFSPQNAQALYAQSPGAPLFRKIDSDQGLGLTYTRLLGDAVIRASVDLPQRDRHAASDVPGVSC